MSAPDPTKVAPLFASPIAAVVETFLKPKLVDIVRKGKAERDSFLIEKRFPIYLESAVEEHSYLKTVVFQDAKQPLLDLYQPLTVKRTLRDGSEDSGILIDSYRAEFLPQHRHVLLIDDAGMGKSTVLRFLFLKCIEEKQGLPIFIELRALKAEQNIVDYLCEKLAPIDEEINPDALRKLIAAGIFVFFIDGYDEIPEAHREGVTQNLTEFIAKSNLNLFILSSRPDPTLTSFAGLQGFSIQGLKLEEAYALIRKYGAVGGGPAEELIAELERDRSSVEEFLENPMLVSLLFKAFSYKRSVPLEKPAFYNQVFDALFEGHDLTKPLYKREKLSKLSRDKFEQVLRALGIVTLKNGVGYPKAQLLAHIDRARQMCPGLEFESSDFLNDLLRQVPLFAQEGDHHRWKHKSLQEYFAAKYIWLDAKEKQTELLLKAAHDEQFRYRNVLSIFYDLDYQTFRNVVINNMLNEFFEYCEHSYSNVDRNIVSEGDINFRKSICSLQKVGLTGVRHEEDLYTTVFIMSKPQSSLLMLIQAKGEDLTPFEAPYEARRWREIAAILPKVDVGTHTFLGDGTGDVEEELASFVNINAMLMASSLPRLDTDKCRTLLAEINADIEREKNSPIEDLI